MAHWLLRGQIAEHRDEERPNERRTPHQKEGDDEAARGGRGVPPSNVGTTPDQTRGREETFAREAREAADDVRRRDSSAE